MPDTVLIEEYELERLQRLAGWYELLARAECRRQNIPPDDLIADDGSAAWQLVGYEVAMKEKKHERT